MPNTYPAERLARIRSTGDRPGWHTGAMIPNKAPLEKADPLEAYAPFLYETMAAAEKAQAEDLVKLWEMVADGDLSTAEAREIDLMTNIHECIVEEDGRIRVFDWPHELMDPAKRHALAKRQLPEGEFEISREAAFAAFEVQDPLAVASPAP